MTRETADPQVTDAITEKCSTLLAMPPASISRTADFYLDLGGDSLEKLELIAWIEERFAVKISDTDAAEVNTIQGLADLVRLSLPG